MKKMLQCSLGLYLQVQLGLRVYRLYAIYIYIDLEPRFWPFKKYLLTKDKS